LQLRRRSEPFLYETINLPRQAQDKHKETLETEAQRFHHAKACAVCVGESAMYAHNAIAPKRFAVRARQAVQITSDLAAAGAVATTQERRAARIV
jgi:hypothetical protein